MQQLRKLIFVFLTLLTSIAFATPYNHLMSKNQPVVHATINANTKTLEFDLSALLYNKYVFALRDLRTGIISYTSSGKFILENGYFKQDGKNLQGYVDNNDLLGNSCELSNIVLSYMLMPQATSIFHLAINLNPQDMVISKKFDPYDDTTYNFNTTSSIYDSLGKSYNIYIYFIKQSSNDWTAQVYVENISIGKGELTFTTDGKLANVEGLSGLAFSPTSGATSPQALSLDLTGSTQVFTPSTIYEQTQDGHSVLNLIAFEVNEIGYINQSFSNGDVYTAGKVAVLQK